MLKVSKTNIAQQQKDKQHVISDLFRIHVNFLVAFSALPTHGARCDLSAFYAACRGLARDAGSGCAARRPRQMAAEPNG